MYKISLSKSIEFSMYLKRRATCYKQKKSNNFCCQTINLLKIWSLLLAFTKGKQNDKSEFGTEIVGTVISKSLLTNPW